MFEGHHLKLFLLTLPDAETAIARVAARVRQGGHDIPIPSTEGDSPGG